MDMTGLSVTQRAAYDNLMRNGVWLVHAHADDRTTYDHLVLSGYAKLVKLSTAERLRAYKAIYHRQTYEIAEDLNSIRCLVCGLTSHNPNDVMEKYCGFCHVFHEDDFLNNLEFLKSQGEFYELFRKMEQLNFALDMYRTEVKWGDFSNHARLKVGEREVMRLRQKITEARNES